MKKTLVILLCLLALTLAVTGCTKQAEAPKEVYPTKEIRVIVPYNPGGTSDVVARSIADIITKKKLLPQPMVIVNIPGAATVDGLREVLNAKADGYTLLVHHTTFSTAYHLGTVPYHYTDFKGVAEIAESPSFFVVHKDAKWKTLQELAEDMKAKPDTIVTSVPGLGSMNHFVLEMMQNEVGGKGRLVVNPGSEQIPNLIGKHTDVAVASLNQFLVEAKAGNVRLLAFSSQDRVKDFPDVPTLKEAGVDVVQVMRFGFWTPKETPDEVISILEKAMSEAVNTPEFKEFAEQQQLMITYRNGSEYEKVMGEDDINIKAVAEVMKANQ